MHEITSDIIKKIKKTAPLILNITNYVSMDIVANGLLSMGARPLMTFAIDEIEDLTRIADAVVINLGTLNDEFIILCENACEFATKYHKLILLDPVGSGASHYRKKICARMLSQYNFSAICGNASEIMTLISENQHGKGVDNNTMLSDLIASLKQDSQFKNNLSVISGETDVILQGERFDLYQRGSYLMPMITGSGCLLTAILASFLVCHDDPYEAACAAVNFYSICGENAAKKSKGPGTFRVLFLDQLSKLPYRGDYDIS